MMVALGAHAAVRTVELGAVDGGPKSSPLFTVTFEDGDDASIAGAVEVTLKAAPGVDLAGASAAGWWLNFDSPAKLQASGLAMGYRIVGDYGLSSYRLMDDAVSGLGAGYGNFDIGITFDNVPGTFAVGDSLELIFQSSGRSLSNTDFFEFEKSTEGGYKPIVSGVRLSDGGVLGGVLGLATPTPGSGPGFETGTPSGVFGGGIQVTPQNESTCRALEVAYAAALAEVTAHPGVPLVGLQYDVFEGDATVAEVNATFQQYYYDINQCPEPSTVLAVSAFGFIGAMGWWRRRRAMVG